MVQYRIEWIDSSTKNKGNGDWHCSKDKKLLEDNIEYMNKKHRGHIKHWLATK